MLRASSSSIGGGSGTRQEIAAACLQMSIALMALVSLNPYFIWEHQRTFYAAATALIILSAIGARVWVWSRERWFLAMAFSLFLIYLSLLPKTDGGTTKWFFLIPFTVAVVFINRDNLQAAFERFHWIFAVSLVPGAVCWLWLVAGLPLEFTFVTVPDSIAQRETTPYFVRLGTVFLPTNGMLLPHGGTVFRLCGIYDEPGTVGTIAALCLAASRFRLGNFRGVACYVAGLMSFSVAFAVMTTIGLLLTAVYSRRLRLLPLALISTVVASVPVLGLNFDIKDPDRHTSISVILPPTQLRSPSAKPTPSGAVPFGLWDNVHLRNPSVFDNRIQPDMRRLLGKYVSSDARTLWFGLASNASNVYAGQSASWTQILTNYGLFGFIWLLGLFATPIVMLWRRREFRDAVLLFSLLFLMSFYQRPIIWLPAQLLIFFGGLYYVDSRERRATSSHLGAA